MKQKPILSNDEKQDITTTRYLLDQIDRLKETQRLMEARHSRNQQDTWKFIHDMSKDHQKNTSQIIQILRDAKIIREE